MRQRIETLSDGSIVSGEAQHVERIVAIDRDMRATERAWISQLRAEGVKAAHPDDGWVDRDESTVHLAYPQFNHGLDVGDRLALGWPWEYRIVRVTGRREPGPIVSPCCEPGQPWRWEFA